MRTESLPTPNTREQQPCASNLLSQARNQDQEIERRGGLHNLQDNKDFIIKLGTSGRLCHFLVLLQLNSKEMIEVIILEFFLILNNKIVLPSVKNNRYHCEKKRISVLNKFIVEHTYQAF